MFCRILVRRFSTSLRRFPHNPVKGVQEIPATPPSKKKEVATIFGNVVLALAGSYAVTLMYLVINEKIEKSA